MHINNPKNSVIVKERKETVWVGLLENSKINWGCSFLGQVPRVIEFHF
jgi:hypothetical protein